ncbi:hypothetical protein SSP24_76460 [Streptomyces spinoverrucosus]|uniref:PPM-type phosphatase domain-containing protein n=1 Tax=Streptomyces spinoverrucosus TaxID=284043 RepID=A0A4Y3VW48_9ACTN|nr:hypothetical protein SSP24_76460 [Streptomyces spinoverrucosus]GHB51667.1 hypothetical protein GCM10010397_22470 [Streptomyces spinoverrucosus]
MHQKTYDASASAVPWFRRRRAGAGHGRNRAGEPTTLARIDESETTDGESEAVTGATCLFAIYDPVSPPLGLGAGLPIETAELRLSEGSRLALYTDGLVEDRDRDIDVGLELLRGALAHPRPDPRRGLSGGARHVPSDPAALGPLRAACARRLRDSLICEVSDGSSTSPHLRRAATTDEGGRGLSESVVDGATSSIIRN